MLASPTPETLYDRDAILYPLLLPAIFSSNKQATMKVIIRSEPASASQYAARYIIRK